MVANHGENKTQKVEKIQKPTLFKGIQKEKTQNKGPQKFMAQQ
jgi:hypothetical protein